MTTLSRRQFMQRSGTFVGAVMATSWVSSGRAGAAERELIPKKFPFPPNDQFGNYEPTITGDGNTIYLALFAAAGEEWFYTKDIFFTYRISQSTKSSG